MAMTPKEMIEVLQHFEAGGDVEFMDLGDTEWRLAGTPIWNFHRTEYRPKPKPLELWGNAHPDGTFCEHADKQSAEECCALGWRVVHMREVVDD